MDRHSLTSPGSIAAVGAYSLFALAAPLTKWLMVHGENLGAHGGAAVSFCNLLTIGNLAAASLVLAITGQKKIIEGMRKLTKGGVVSLAASVLFSIATPAAFFFALQSTAVSNVILISRAGPIFFAIGGTLLLGRSITKHQWIGYGFIVVAISMAMLFNSETMLGVGDLLAIAAAFGAAMASLVGRTALEQMDLKPFVFARNLASATGFAAIALVLFGPRHFADLIQPNIVVGISAYGILVVGAAQLLWFFAIVHATPKTVGGWSFISPLSAIILTEVLLHERPHMAQCIALLLVLVGMIIASRGQRLPPKPPSDATLAAA